MYRSYGTRKKLVRFLGGLKSAAIKLTEPTALLAAKNLWVMDRVLNLRQVRYSPLITSFFYTLGKTKPIFPHPSV